MSPALYLFHPIHKLPMMPILKSNNLTSAFPNYSRKLNNSKSPMQEIKKFTVFVSVPSNKCVTTILMGNEKIISTIRNNLRLLHVFCDEMQFYYGPHEISQEETTEDLGLCDFATICCNWRLIGGSYNRCSISSHRNLPKDQSKSPNFHKINKSNERWKYREDFHLNNENYLKKVPKPVKELNFPVKSSKPRAPSVDLELPHRQINEYYQPNFDAMYQDSFKVSNILTQIYHINENIFQLKNQNDILEIKIQQIITENNAKSININDYLSKINQQMEFLNYPNLSISPKIGSSESLYKLPEENPYRMIDVEAVIENKFTKFKNEFVKRIEESLIAHLQEKYHSFNNKELEKRLEILEINYKNIEKSTNNTKYCGKFNKITDFTPNFSSSELKIKELLLKYENLEKSLFNKIAKISQENDNQYFDIQQQINQFKKEWEKQKNNYSNLKTQNDENKLLKSLNIEINNLRVKIDHSEKDLVLTQNLMQVEINVLKSKLNSVECLVMQEFNKLKSKCENLFENMELSAFIEDYKLNKLKVAADFNFLLKEKTDNIQMEKLCANFSEMKSAVSSLLQDVKNVKNSIENNINTQQKEMNDSRINLLEKSDNCDACVCNFDCEKRLNILEDFMISMQNNTNTQSNVIFPCYKSYYYDNGIHFWTAVRIKFRKMNTLSQRLPYKIYYVLSYWPYKQHFKFYTKFFGLPSSWIASNYKALSSSNLLLNATELSNAWKYEKDYDLHSKNFRQGFRQTHRAKGPDQRLAKQI